MASNSINHKVVILGVAVAVIIGIIAFSMLKGEDSLVTLLYNIPERVNLIQNAPQATLDYLAVSSAPNYFTNCDFMNNIYYIDSTGAKRLLGHPSIDAVPFMSITSDQTNRQVIKFTGDIQASCHVKTGYEKLVPTLDSGFVNLEITATKADGSTVKAYSKTTQLSLKGKDLTKTFTLFTFEIPASDIESKLPIPSANQYKSFIKIKPNIQLTIYFKGDNPNNKWTVGGQTTTSLSARVTNDKFMCVTACIINNKEIKLKVERPSNGQLTLDDRRLSFTVVLPEWTEDQGNPSYSVTDDIGLNAVPKSKLTLTKMDSTNGVFHKEVLLPATTGEFTLKIEQQNRNTEQSTIKIIAEKPVSQKCTSPDVLVDGKCVTPDGGSPPPKDPSAEGCDEGQLEHDIGGVIFCAKEGSAEEWVLNNIGLTIFIIIIFLVLVGILTRKRN